MTSLMSPKEPFGTTPLPTSSSGSPVRVTWNAEGVLSSAQQPQSQQIAVFEATLPDIINGKQLDVNGHFVCYTVKNGLIRVLHRTAPLKHLLRGHAGHNVTDLQFFHEGDILATVGHDATSSKVLIWRIFEQSPEIKADLLLEIQTTTLTLLRVVWHPFNPNQFWMIHQNKLTQRTNATLVETTRISTNMGKDGHPVCNFFDHGDIIVQGCIQIDLPGITDLCWCGNDTRHVVSTHADGKIILWDLHKFTSVGDTASPQQVAVVQDAPGVSRVRFLPHSHVKGSNPQGTPLTHCFMTASEQNSVITLWAPFENGSSQRVQVLTLEQPASNGYVVDVCSGPAPANASPPSCFIVMADRCQGKLFSFHCRAEWSEHLKPLLVGVDYVVPFVTKSPVYTWSVICSPTADISEEELNEQGGLVFDVKLFSYQKASVQCLTLTSYMQLPPGKSWTDPTPNVRVERLMDVHSAHVSEIGSDDDKNEISFDEEYEVEEEANAAEDSYDVAPEPSALPLPGATMSAANPFSNWLGALATNSTSAPLPPPVVAPPASVLPMPIVNPPTPVHSQPEGEFLSPMDMLSSKSSKENSSGKKQQSRDATPVQTNRTANTKQKGSAPEPIVILQRPVEKPSKVPPAPMPSSKELTKEIRAAVRDEVRSLVIPAIEKAIHGSINVSVINPVQASINDLSKSGVNVDKKALSGALAPPLRAAFADSIKSVLVPAMDSMSQQVLAQVSLKLEQSKPDGELEAISKQLAQMTELVTKLSQEVAGLKTAMAAQTPPAVPSAATPTVSMIQHASDIRDEISALLRARKYEAAFAKALSASSTDVTMFCCKSANVSDILGGAKPELSQPILLCILQQLGAVLGTSTNADFVMVIEWLQEVAYSLNPALADASVQRHIPQVLQQLVASIQKRMSMNDPALQRPLQRLLQVIRGMQHM